MNKEILYKLGLNERQVVKVLCIYECELSGLKNKIKELKKETIPTRKE